MNMGIKERKEREKRMRKDSILKAAEKLFFRRGLDTITIEEIANEAELAKGTIYRYFKNKDELILTITLKAARIFNTIGEKLINQCTGTWDKISAALKAYQIFYTDYPDYFKLFIQWDNIKIDFNTIPERSIHAEYLKETNKIHENFLKIIKQGIEEKVIREIDDPKKTLFIFMTVIFGYFRTLVTRMDLIEKRFGYSFNDCKKGLVILIERTFKL
jgi:AcrR family transcriptional regulator